MAERFIVEKFLFVLVLFIVAVLMLHAFMVKVFQSYYFVNYLTASCISGAILLIVLYIIIKFNKSLERQIGNFLYFKGKRYYKALLKEAITDGLTNLYDHKYFMLRLEEEIERAKRYLRPLSLLMIDIDYFKEYNDAFGHQKGDELLVKIAGVFKRFTRRVDMAARYGGEEFVIILPETPMQGAVIVAERLRKCIEEIKFNERKKVTISIGIGTFDGAKFAFEPGTAVNAQKTAFTKEDLIKMADDALYRAKNNGKNRVEA
jgi:diguanylate cyclase (GGDEF)-like protein